MISKKFHIPIYDARLYVYAKCEDVRAAREYRGCVKIFDRGPEGDYVALCSYTPYGEFGLWLPRKVPAATLAHEIFHVTHRILEWSNCNFDEKHHEVGAMLNGYLHALIRPLV